MTQDTFQRAKERFEDATEAFRETRVRMEEDAEFSNPADPKQWDDLAMRLRTSGPDGARPCLTLDRTNQQLVQVVNDARQNKPGLTAMPATSGARQEVAKAIEGLFRHIEYQSRAQIAYDTALESAARLGIGWIRIHPEVVNPELNHQEIRIKRVHDALSIVGDPDWTEPDGSDMQYVFAETQMSKRAFADKYPKADQATWQGNKGPQGWFSDKSMRIAEYFEVVEASENRLGIVLHDGQRLSVTEDEYWAKSKEFGYQPMVQSQFTAKKRGVKWRTMNGCEILEETDFPSRWLPLIPVIGHESWVKGKRYLCGMVRRMMESQRAYNYERSAWVEAVALQPKAPFIGPWEAIANHYDKWQNANKTNASILPYDHLDDSGQPLPAPQRMAPPTMPAAFAQGAQFAVDDLRASVGMNKASLGEQGTAVSGRAKLADKHEGDIANFHYHDNLSRSIEQCGRVILDMIPRLYDQPRETRIIGVDGSSKPVVIDPTGDTYSEREDGSLSINLGTGSYDVCVKTGPSYTTLRQEASEGLNQIMQGNPAFAAVVGPIWARMQDWPESDKLSKALLAMAPPPVQAALGDEQKGDDPEALKQQLQQIEQQAQQMQQMLEQAAARIQELESGDKELTLKYLAESAKIENDTYKAETDRLKALQPAVTVDQVAPLVQQVIAQMMAAEPLQGGEELERTAQSMAGLPDSDPIGGGMGDGDPPKQMELEPMEAPQQIEQPADAGFFTPEQGG